MLGLLQLFFLRHLWFLDSGGGRWLFFLAGLLLREKMNAMMIHTTIALSSKDTCLDLACASFCCTCSVAMSVDRRRETARWPSMAVVVAVVVGVAVAGVVAVVVMTVLREDANQRKSIHADRLKRTFHCNGGPRRSLYTASDLLLPSGHRCRRRCRRRLRWPLLADERVEESHFPFPFLSERG